MFCGPQYGLGDLYGCRSKTPFMEDIQKIACATDDLKTAVQRNNLLRKLSQTNFFASISPNDVVRSEESLSLFNQSLKRKIEETHEEYQKLGKDRYTLSISSYVSEIEEGTCSEKKTIDVVADSMTGSQSSTGHQNRQSNLAGGRESEKPIAHYTTVPGKKPRSFHVRQYKGKFVLCERTEQSYQNRLSTYCGKKQDEHSDDFSKCKKSLTPSCAKLDEKGGTLPSLSACLSGEDFGVLAKRLLIRNKALEWKYCPGDCSYYTQTLQAFYKKNRKGEYCSDNYLIVHCGPKKKSSKYNLNIREINDLCRDLEFCSYL